MKKIFSTILATIIIVNVLAQKKTCQILSADAFYSVVLPGNIPVDENGNPRKLKPNLSRSIFISSNCNIVPVINKVLYDNISAPFFIEKAAKEEVSNLTDDANNKIKLTAPKSSFLWKISIVQSGTVSIPEKPTVITIEWKQKTKVNKWMIKKEAQLSTLPTY